MLRLRPIFSITFLLACSTEEKTSQQTPDNPSDDVQDSSEDNEVEVPLSEQGQWAAQYHKDIKDLVQAEEQFSQLNHLEELVEKVEDNKKVDPPRISTPKKYLLNFTSDSYTTNCF